MAPWLRTPTHGVLSDPNTDRARRRWVALLRSHDVQSDLCATLLSPKVMVPPLLWLARGVGWRDRDASIARRWQDAPSGATEEAIENAG